jgi:ABC-type polysaccharide/polyol phosphate export permease
MLENLQEFWRYRELLYMIVYRDIKIRYKQSIMGFLWAILMPILIVMSGIIVRYGYALASHSPLKTEDLVGVAVKSIPWAFLVSSVRASCNSLTSNGGLVTKIYFPKEILPIASVMTSLFDFVVGFAALSVCLVIAHVGWSVYLWWTPVLLLAMLLLAIGIAMFVSAASLFFRDVKYIVEVLLTFGIFFTPVFYDTRMFGDKAKWFLINPIAPILEGLNACMTRHQSPDLPWLAYSFAFSLTVLVSGHMLFKRLESVFAESM